MKISTDAGMSLAKARSMANEISCRTRESGGTVKC